MITRWLVRRIDDRLGFSPAGRRRLLDRVLPDHWSFLLGELAVYSFLYLVVSGIFLSLYFSTSDAKVIYHGNFTALDGTSVSAPYASVVKISWDVRFGLVMRQSHHWAALILAGAIVVHLARVFFTGGFRRPRELNWMIGVALLLLAMANGFTGYDLPDDLLSGMGLNIVNAVLLAIPFIGGWLSFMLFGGEFPGHDIIRRLFAIHAIIVPALMAGLIVLHLLIVMRQRHAQFPGPGRTDTNVVGPRLWPARAVRSLGLLSASFSVFLFLGGMVQIDPIWLWGDTEPGRTMGPSQPDWYMGWIDGALRLMPGWEPTIFGWRMPNMFLPALVMPGLSFMLLLFWPFIERRFTGDRRAHELLERPRDRPVRMGIGVMALTFYGLLLTAWGLDVVSRFTGVPQFRLVDALRFGVLGFPLVTGFVAFLLTKALRDSGAEKMTELTWQELKGALRRKPLESEGRPEEMPEERSEEKSEKSKEKEPEQPLSEGEREGGLPIEAGPVP